MSQERGDTDIEGEKAGGYRRVVTGVREGKGTQSSQVRR